MDLSPELLARLQSLGLARADVEERFVRGSGPGGQKINKTSSTVALRHRPSGIEVRCQRERSQAANRELAWRELCDRLEAARRAQAAAARSAQELDRRRNRQRSRTQKRRLVAEKRRHSARKAERRGRPDG